MRPSGHAITAFAVAISLFYPLSFPVLLTLAFLIAASRKGEPAMTIAIVES